jgi:hypothetical protein
MKRIFVAVLVLLSAATQAAPPQDPAARRYNDEQQIQAAVDKVPPSIALAVLSGQANGVSLAGFDGSFYCGDAPDPECDYIRPTAIPKGATPPPGFDDVCIAGVCFLVKKP